MFINLIKTGIILFSAISISACSGKKVSIDFDTGTDFSQIKTYQWDKQPSAAFAKTNQLIDKRIVEIIEKNLALKNLTLSEPADIKISYSINFEKKLSSSSLSGGIGMSVGKSRRGHISLSSGNNIKQTIDGTLLIDMVSIKTDSLIWRSTSTERVTSSSSPEKSEKKINRLVSDMLEIFPPVPGK